jgi:hypothetical protein
MTCELCRKGGSVARRRLVPLAMLKRSVVAGATRDPRNEVLLCIPCERALRVFQRLATPDETTGAIAILFAEGIDRLLERAAAFRKAALEGQMYGPLGSAPKRSDYQLGLEGFGR